MNFADFLLYLFNNCTIYSPFPLIIHIIVACASNIIRMAGGCFICVNVNIVNILVDISVLIISGGILYIMLILGINEIVFAFPLKF